MEYYREQLYETVNIDDKKGNTLTLTLDHQLQMKVKELLMKEMRVSDKGSAIILDAKTGEILSMISFPSWDANDLDNSITKMNHAPMEEEAFYPITHKGGEVPGSIFKIIMAVSMIDNGLESFMAKDTEFNAGPAPIRNDYGSKDEIIDYKQALIRSSNVFFAKAALEMGGKSLTETAEKFMIGKDLELDFGTVNSNWNLNPKSKSDIAYTAFGQGKTLFSTISAAQMMGAIANDGLMLTPYLVQTIGNEKNGEIYTGEPKELSQVTSKETADKVTEVLKETARSYIPAIEGRKNQEVFEKYSIACKTGTGERGDKEDSNNAWAVSFAPADDPEYVVVVNQCKTKKYGRHMLDTTAGIYRYLFEEYKK